MSKVTHSRSRCSTETYQIVKFLGREVNLLEKVEKPKVVLTIFQCCSRFLPRVQAFPA